MDCSHHCWVSSFFPTWFFPVMLMIMFIMLSSLLLHVACLSWYGIGYFSFSEASCLVLIVSIMIPLLDWFISVLGRWFSHVYSFCGVASHLVRCSVLFGNFWLGLEDGGCH